MELDTQVEETLLPDSSNPEPKRKHKSKDKHKHKHKHHKRSRRDRNTDASPEFPSQSGPLDGAAPTGFEDGELPGPPAAEQEFEPVVVNDNTSPADAPEILSAGHAAAVLHPTIRSMEETPTESGKLSNVVDYAATPGHSQSQQPVPDAGNLDTAAASIAQSAVVSTSVHELNGHSRDRADRASRDKSHRRSHTEHNSGKGSHDTERQPTDRHTHSSNQRPSDRARPPGNSSKHRSSSQRPTEHAQRDIRHQPSHRVARADPESSRSLQHATGSNARGDSRHPVERTDSRRPAERTDSRRPMERTDSRQPGRDMRQHGRDCPRDARPQRRGYDRRDDRHHGQARDSHRDRGGDRDKRKRDDKEDKEAEQEFVAKVEAALQSNDVDEDRLIEERRRRRQEILAKHQQENQAGPTTSVSGTSVPSAGSPQPSAPVQPSLSRGHPPHGPTQANGVPRSESAQSIRDTAQTAHVDMLAELPPEGQNDRVMDGATSPSISDDEQYQKLDSSSLWQQGPGHVASNGMPAGTIPAPDVEPEVQQASMDDREVPKQAAEETQQAAAAVPAKIGKGAGLDMFADELDADMFSDAPMTASAVAPEKKALLDNYDDAEGYYNFQVGEIMDGRYEVFATHGKGVFSSVLRARDKQNPVPGTEVAIKMIRSNETMYKAAQTEKIVLRKLAGADPEGRRHCIKLLRTFEYRSHLCLVFEAMDINLRELTKKYGRGIGLNIAAVSKYAAQMLISLYHLRNCGVLHADIKPDNILVSASRTMVKLADFGSAMFSGDNEITPYLVSRFYRAPEVILGLKYDHALDIWSVGCVIYELFTGAILFPGQTNNQMLKLMMDVKGPFPKKMLKKGVFTDRHFEDDPNMSFALLEEDQVTKRPIRRTIAAPHIKKDFAGLLAGSEGDRKKIVQLADLLERMMALDPDKRITPKDALKHPFIKEAK